MDEFDEKVDHLLSFLETRYGSPETMFIRGMSWELARMEFRRAIRETILAFNSLPLVDDGS